MKRRGAVEGESSPVRQSDRILLRPLCATDEEAFIESIDNEVLLRNGFNARNIEWYRRSFRKLARKRFAGFPCYLALCDRPTGRFIGQYQIHCCGHVTAEMGWWLSSDGRGRGLGVESLVLALDYVHQDMEINRVTMGTSNDNERARRQMLRAGAKFTHEAPHRLPNREKVTGLWFEHVVGPYAR